MKIFETELKIPPICHSDDPLGAAREYVTTALGPGIEPIRFVISASDEDHCYCEVGLIDGTTQDDRAKLGSIFEFRQRGPEQIGQFNVGFLVPTGIGASIGGHAGDATPAVRAIAELCDNVILHPNVVNASDVNEMPDNALYVEGSVLARLLMGTVGLQKLRANRVLVVMDKHPDEEIQAETINTVNSARATYGFNASDVLLLDPPIALSANYTASGRASGTVERIDHLLEALRERAGSYDAVALATMMEVSPDLEAAYFASNGEIVNPWGGAEAIFTHALSGLFDVPTAHAPISESKEAARVDLGLVDPRMAAEAISHTFLQCVLKGLRQSPRIVESDSTGGPEDVMTAEDLSCLVIPDKCVGLPTLAALKQGIPVIAVRENESILDNDLTKLPWAPGQFYRVENYWEAVGVLSALKAGIDPQTMRRPIERAPTEIYRSRHAQDAHQSN